MIDNQCYLELIAFAENSQNRFRASAQNFALRQLI